MKTQIQRHGRPAFTLIELLVVISIIALLCSLLMAAVFRALTVVKDVQNRNDISQLESAVASFKNTFQVDYMPSTFNPADAESRYFMSRLFPQCDPATVAWPAGPLEGHQCLVFFLGGVQQGGTCYGFSSNPKDPMLAPTAGEVRRGPFFDFRSNRLVANYGGYIDVYGSRPFAYFSTRGTPGSYANDCSLIVGGPYKDASGGFIRADSFQIISAGVNTQFGPGGVWDPPTMPAAGKDDLANFATSKLGYRN